MKPSNIKQQNAVILSSITTILMCILVLSTPLKHLEFIGPTAATLTIVAVFVFFLQSPLMNCHSYIMIFFVLFQCLVPAAYYFELSWSSSLKYVTQGTFVTAAQITLVSICCYMIGVKLAGKKHFRLPSVTNQALRSSDVMPTIKTLTIIASLSWLLLFFLSGIDFSVFFLTPPSGRTRDYFADVLYGHNYFSNAFCFQANVALTIYLLAKKKNSIFSWKIILLLYLTMLANVFNAQRLVMFGPIAVLVLAYASQLHLNNQSASARIYSLIKIIAVILLGVSLSYIYGFYRTGALEYFTFEQAAFILTNIFDTSTTFLMVLERTPHDVDYWYGKSIFAPVLQRIPTVFIPWKYDVLYDAAKFTELFYGYNQRDTDISSVSRSPSLFAILYLNFGVYGLCTIFLSLGFISQIFFNTYRAGTHFIFSTTLYLTYIAYFIPYLFKSGLFGSISHIDARILPLFAIVYFRKLIRK